MCIIIMCIIMEVQERGEHSFEGADGWEGTSATRSFKLGWVQIDGQNDPWAKEQTFLANQVLKLLNK